MKTKVAPSSIEAATHMKEYTTMIRTKNKELKNKKDIQSDTKAELFSYVKDLKSTPEHKVLAAKYHEDMKKARILFTTIIRGSDMASSNKIKEMFATIKQHLYSIDEKKWDNHIKTLQKFFSTLSDRDREKLLGRIWRKTEDPEMVHRILHEIQKKKPHMSFGKKAGEVRNKTINEWPLMPIVGGGLLAEDLIALCHRDRNEYFLLYALFFLFSAVWLVSVPLMFKEKKKELDDGLRENRQNAVLGRRGGYNSRGDGCDHSEI